MTTGLHPGERPRLALLAAAAVLLSLGLACATPFPALAALCAQTLTRRAAALAVGLAFLANQAVGFGWLGYPRTAPTLAWGLAIGLAALAGLAAAQGIARARPRAATTGAVAASVGLAGLGAAFLAYEAVLALAALVLPGSAEAFAPAVLGRILLINVAAFAGLAALDAAARALTPPRAARA